MRHIILSTMLILSFFVPWAIAIIAFPAGVMIEKQVRMNTADVAAALETSLHCHPCQRLTSDVSKFSCV